MNKATKKAMALLNEARRNPESASDELLEVVAPNRYIQRKLADPDGRYLILASRDLERVSALCKEHGIYAELKALDIEAVPYELDLESGE